MVEKAAKLFIIAGGCMILLAFVVDWIELSKPGFRRLHFLLAFLGCYSIITGIYIKIFRESLTREISFKKLTSLIRKNRIDILLTFILFVLGIALATSYVASIQANGTSNLFYPPTAILELPHQFKLFQPLFPHGILFGLTSALAYCIFRVGGIGQVLSVIGCFGFMTSSIHLYNLIPSPLRDYAKTPFILAVVLVSIMIVVLPLKRRGIIILSAVGGFFLGIGMFVRQDLFVFIFLLMISLVLFLPSPFHKQIKLKATILVLLAVILMPQLLTVGKSGAFRIIGGLMTPIDERLGVTRPIYDYGYLFLDEFIWTYPYGQAMISNPEKKFLYTRTEGEVVQHHFLTQVIKNFPADMLTRGYAALVQVLEIPFTYLLPPVGIANPAINTIYSVRAGILGMFSGAGILLISIAILILSIHSLRLTFFALFLLLFLGCYPALQFQGRHYFYLEFITWWAIGFIAQHFVLTIVRFINRPRDPELKDYLVKFRLIELHDIKFRRILIFVLSSIILIFVPLLGLRYYQNMHLHELLQQYKQLELEPLAFTKEVLSNGNILFSMPINHGQYMSNNIAADYIVADFNYDKCKRNTIWPTIRYSRNPEYPAFDFSRLLNIDINQSGVTKSRFLLPVFSAIIKSSNDKYNSTRFSGIEMAPLEAPCMDGLFRIKDASRLPLLMTIVPGTTETLYQRLNLERNSIYTVPYEIEPNVLDIISKQSIFPLTPNDLDFKADIVNIQQNNWEIRGYAANLCAADTCNMPNRCQTDKRLASTIFAVDFTCVVKTDLVWTKKIMQKKGNYFLAQGELYNGGVTFGLVKDKRTAGSVTVTKRGPFLVIIQVPEDGLYSVGLANSLDLYTSLENRFSVEKIGWAILPDGAKRWSGKTRQ